jgi:hypothetical protein
MKRRDIIKLGGAVWITPVVQAITLPAHAETSAYIQGEPRDNPDDPPCDDCVVDPNCIDCDPQGECPDEWNKSSFVFGEDDPILCNTGSGPSLCEIRWEITRTLVSVVSRIQPIPAVVAEGTVPPMGYGCYDFSDIIAPYIDADGKHCLKAYQDQGHPGIGFTTYCF